MGFGALRVEGAAVAVQADVAALDLLDAVGIYVDVLLHIERQRRGIALDKTAQVAAEDVELLQVGVGPGDDLGQECVEAHEVGDLAAEVGALGLGQSG